MTDLQIIIATMGNFRTASSNPRSRLVLAWLKRAHSKELDVMARLQFLEGAAGIREGTLSNEGFAALKRAPTVFPGVHPEWFTRANSGLFAAVLSIANKEVGTSFASLGVSGEDVVMDQMSGKSVYKERGTSLFWEAGKYVGLKALVSSQKTPAHEGNTSVKAFIRREIWLMRRDEQNHRRLREENQGVIAPSSSKEDFWRVMERLLKVDTSRLGNSLREALSRNWKGDKHEAALDLWMQKMLQGRATYRDLSMETGVDHGVIRRKVERYLKQFRDWLYKNQRLMDAIYSQMETGRLAGTATTMDLKNELTRLAAENPELREHLLPLLRKQARFDFRGQVASHISKVQAMNKDHRKKMASIVTNQLRSMKFNVRGDNAFVVKQGVRYVWSVEVPPHMRDWQTGQISGLSQLFDDKFGITPTRIEDSGRGALVIVEIDYSDLNY